MAAGMLLPGCSKDESKSADTGLKTVYTVTAGGTLSGSAVHKFAAVAEEGRSVNAAFKTGGQITRLTVSEGDYVRKGQVIGLLDDTDYRLQHRQVMSQLSQLEGEMKRLEEMRRHNNIAPNDYEKAAAGLEQLRIQAEMLQRQLDYTRLEAPASGYIVDSYMEEGEMTGAGTPVFRILDTAGIETSVALPASVYKRRSEMRGFTARTAVTGDQAIPLEVISFIPDGDNNSLFRLRLRLPSHLSATVLPGMNMTVEIAFDSADGDATAVLPSRAIFKRDGSEYVWVVNHADSIVSSRRVTLVGLPDGPSQRVSGLKGDEQVVAAGVNHLQEGQKVKVAGDINALK